MKIFILLTPIFLFMNSCSRNDDEWVIANPSVKEFAGNWKLTETYISPGGETTCQEIEVGHAFKFSADGTYTQTESDCSSEIIALVI